MVGAYLVSIPNCEVQPQLAASTCNPHFQVPSTTDRTRNALTTMSPCASPQALVPLPVQYGRPLSNGNLRARGQRSLRKSEAGRRGGRVESGAEWV